MMPGQEPFSLKARVARSMFWIAWSRGALQLLTFATTLVVAHILVPADYGVMALASFWTGMAVMLAEMGLGTAIIQFRDLDRQEIDTCFQRVLAEPDRKIIDDLILRDMAPDRMRLVLPER